MNEQELATFLILTTIKITILLGAAVLCLRLMRASTASSRHLICIFSLAGVILLPLLTLVMPSWRVNSAFLGFAEIASSHRGSLPIGTARVSVSRESALVVLWLIGVSVCLLRSLAGWILVRKERSKSTPLRDEIWRNELSTIAKNFRLNPSSISLCIGRVSSTVVCGSWRPSILVPSAACEWSPFHRRAVLLHELAHIRRSDAFVQQVAQISCAIFWFHPMVWMLAARLSHEQELACDDAVLMAGMTPASYAGILLETARALPSRFLLACGFTGNPPARRLRARFAHLLDSHRDHRTKPRLPKSLLPAFALVLLLLGSLKPIEAAKIYDIGGEVSAPTLVAMSEPEYTAEAKNKGIQGAVLLSVVVATDGRAHNVHVERSLDSGLDANAVHTVEGWRFKPAQRNGKPVAVHARIEVNFRLQ